MRRRWHVFIILSFSTAGFCVREGDEDDDASSALQALRWKWHERLLHNLQTAETATLATVSPDGTPELSLMFAGFDEKHNQTVFSSNNDMKVHFIRGHHRVAAMFNQDFSGNDDEAFENDENVAVTLYGNAKLMTYEENHDEYDRLMAILQHRHPGYARAFVGRGKVVITIRPYQALIVDVANQAIRVQEPLGDDPHILGSGASVDDGA